MRKQSLPFSGRKCRTLGCKTKKYDPGGATAFGPSHLSIMRVKIECPSAREEAVQNRDDTSNHALPVKWRAIGALFGQARYPSLIKKQPIRLYAEPNAGCRLEWK